MALTIRSLFVTVNFIAILSCNSNSENSVKKETSDSTAKTATVEPNKDSTAYNKVLTFGNISFDVTSIKEGSLQQVTIQSSGLAVEKKVITLKSDPIMAAEVGDLNGDGHPELLIFTQSVGSGSYGKVIAFSVNAGKSISQVSFPEIGSETKIKKGYMGHDKFSIVNNQLTREFPIYSEGDPNVQPSGKKRVITYKLRDGEASRVFVVDKVREM